MDILGIDAGQILGYIIFLLTAVWGGAKIVIGAISKSIDEGEDVVRVAGETMKEASEMLTAVVDMLKPDPDGSIKIDPAEWERVRKETEDVKKKAKELPKELNEFMASLKGAFGAVRKLFKKNKKE